MRAIVFALILGLAIVPLAPVAGAHHSPLHVCDHDGRSCDDDEPLPFGMCSTGLVWKLGVCRFL